MLGPYIYWCRNQHLKLDLEGNILSITHCFILNKMGGGFYFEVQFVVCLTWLLWGIGVGEVI